MNETYLSLLKVLEGYIKHKITIWFFIFYIFVIFLFLLYPPISSQDELVSLINTFITSQITAITLFFAFTLFAAEFVSRMNSSKMVKLVFTDSSILLKGIIYCLCIFIEGLILIWIPHYYFSFTFHLFNSTYIQIYNLISFYFLAVFLLVVFSAYLLILLMKGILGIITKISLPNKIQVLAKKYDIKNDVFCSSENSQMFFDQINTSIKNLDIQQSIDAIRNSFDFFYDSKYRINSAFINFIIEQTELSLLIARKEKQIMVSIELLKHLLKIIYINIVEDDIKNEKCRPINRMNRICKIYFENLIDLILSNNFYTAEDTTGLLYNKDKEKRNGEVFPLNILISKYREDIDLIEKIPCEDNLDLIIKYSNYCQSIIPKEHFRGLFNRLSDINEKVREAINPNF